MPSTAQAAPASAWVGGLAAAWARPAAERWESATLDDVFAGVLDIHVAPGEQCQPNVSVSPPAASGLALVASLVGFPNRTECPASVPVSILNIGLKAAMASDVQFAKTELLSALPKNCFDGVLPSDGRRRAPPSHMTVWADPHRVLTFVWGDYDPTVLTVTYVRRDLVLPDPAEQEVYDRVRTSLLRPIPANCLSQTP